MVLIRIKQIAPLVILSILATSIYDLPDAHATSTTVPLGNIGLYMDEPFVQGSYANSSTTATETFDQIQVDPGSQTKSCGETNSIQVGELLPSCTIFSPDSPASETFSASNSSGDPTIGGSPSGFLTSDPGNGYAVTFAESKKYIGFWWATASAGNLVRFYSNSSLVAEISTDGVNSLIGSAPIDDASYAADTSTVTSVDGTQQYFKKFYFGNPRHYAEFAGRIPDALQTSAGSAPSEAFVYLHAFAGDGVSFNRVEFSTTSSGFEIDNLTTSTDSIDVDPRLVLIQNVPTQGTYSGLAASSGQGDTWINLQGSQLARTGDTDPGYQTIYWMGRDTNGNWSAPLDLEATGGTVRNHATDSSVDVHLPTNEFTHIIFWIDWCQNLRDGPCVALHYGDFDINNLDPIYRYRRTRTVTYQTTGSGSILGDSLQTVTYGNSTSSVTAVPVTGWQFVKWSDDLADPPSIPATRNDLNITANTVVTAEFSIVSSPTNSATPTPTVTTSATPTPTTSVTPTPTVMPSATTTPAPTPSPTSTHGASNAPTVLANDHQFYELSGFSFEKSSMNKDVKNNLKSLVKLVGLKYSGTLLCQGQTGFNWNKRSKKFIKSLANSRAKNVCKFLKSKYPKAKIKIIPAVSSDSLLPESRKVTIFLDD